MGQDQDNDQKHSEFVSDKDLEKVSGGCDLAELSDAAPKKQDAISPHKSGKAGALRRVWNDWFG
ncbi:hypothetical protein [Paracoccus sp. (in: a-proteobacteria)]|uniref:hypothetical protein n=1 Tax=Paracoccus sp. TaxID=267 RepID=UPI002AFFF312|nr:hypothetical protein [Paracoccus sp. (in: a-proteobacteria)]